MKVAVVGAGFCGLSVCRFLLEEGLHVDLYDEKGIGGGASGIASGLVHPYVGEQVRRSWKATEALEKTNALIALAQEKSSEVLSVKGIIRVAETEMQRLAFLEHAENFHDVCPISENEFFISSGMTVHSKAYLDGLFLALKEKGVHFFQKKISSIEDLASYDHIVLTIGSGVFSFPGLDSLPFSATKGQVLTCQWSEKALLTQSRVGKCHIIPLDQSYFSLGATYERGQMVPIVDLSYARKELEPKAKALLPALQNFIVCDGKAGIRVTRKGHYMPIVGALGKKVWILSALGSRGLLYHAYLGEIVARMVLGQKVEELPNQMQVGLFKN